MRNVRIADSNMNTSADNNNGSAVIEMCIIGPLLISVVFFIINIFLVSINKSISMREACHAICTREDYIMDDAKNYKYNIEQQISVNMNSKCMLIDNLHVGVRKNETNKIIISNLRGFDEGEFVIDITYRNICKGVIFQGINAFEDGYQTRQEIRDTSNNLRRWQMYGDELPD